MGPPERDGKCHRCASSSKYHNLRRITNAVNELRLILSRLEQAANESELNFDETNIARLTTLEVLCQEGAVLPMGGPGHILS
jgi:hypothetical protein